MGCSNLCRVNLPCSVTSGEDGGAEPATARVAENRTMAIKARGFDWFMGGSISPTIVLNSRLGYAREGINRQNAPVREPWLWPLLLRGSSAGRWFQANGASAWKWRLLRRLRLESRLRSPWRAC